MKTAPEYVHKFLFLHCMLIVSRAPLKIHFFEAKIQFVDFCSIDA